MWSDEDRKFMKMALDLAVKGLGRTDPNPMVGAVIVRDGRIIAEGWHREYGNLHAEREALASCTEDPAGATMYVTLEPCCHFGKQPPCTSAIVESGISKVVVAMTDPNPLVAGHGLEILRSRGIEVQTGLMEAEARQINRVFLKYITTGQPWIALKSAMTLDGRIASAEGDSRWVSSEESRMACHRMRGQFAGIMAGIGTVMADDPMLNCRIGGMRQPVRIIVDSRASMPADSALARTAGEYRTILAHVPDADKTGIAALQELGVETMECLSDADGRVDIGDMLVKLGKRKIASILVEGGAGIAWSMVSGGFVDEYFFFVAPKIIGGDLAKGPVGGKGFGRMNEALPVDIESVTPSGPDWLIHGFRHREDGKEE